MNPRRISEQDAVAVMQGRTPEGREDLAELASVIEQVRHAAFEAPPQQSAALAARLDLEYAVRVSRSAGEPQEQFHVHARASLRGARTLTRRVKLMFSWFVGLGLAAKIGLGAAVAVAGTAVAGGAGVLPPPAQVVFDSVLSGVEQDEAVDAEVEVEGEGEVRPEGVPNENAADPAQVVEEAHQRGEDARTRAEQIREEAQQRVDEALAEVEDLRDEAAERGDEALAEVEDLRDEAAERGDEARSNVEQLLDDVQQQGTPIVPGPGTSVQVDGEANVSVRGGGQR